MAIGPKGNLAASDVIMTPDKMKPLLSKSKQEPVQAAIGLTAGGEGIILLSSKMEPKKVLSALRAEASKAKLQLNSSSLRFGRAEVDVDYDAGTVRFSINKEPPGSMPLRLVDVVKRVGYQKVEFIVDPSLELEPEEDAHAEAPAAGLTAPPPAPDAATLTAELGSLAHQIQQAAGGDSGLKARLLKLATDANAGIKAGQLENVSHHLAALRAALDGAGTGSTPEADAHSVAAELAALVRQIAEVSGAGPQVRADLMHLATEANTSLKSGNMAQASQLVAQLRGALEAAHHPSAPSGTKPGRATGDDLLALFRDAKEEVDDGLNRLRAALLETADDDMVRISEYGLYGMSDGGGVGLMKALLDLRGASPDTSDSLLKAARDAASAFKAAVFEDPAVDLVDHNPFGVEVGLRTKLGTVLDTIAAAV